ncbi:MAG: MoaD/ThiS family protein [Chloroflexi bacterium]|nr:MoaD/ThiS family protein [Chloroflexota bacterium]
MGAVVRIPTPLRRVTGGKDQVTVNATSLVETINDLERQFPGIKERLCDASGQLHRFVNIYVNGEDVRFLQGLNTAVKTGDEVSIVPAVAGGA